MASRFVRRGVAAALVAGLGVVGVSVARGDGERPLAAAAADAAVTTGSVTHAWTVRSGRTRVDVLRVSGITPANAKVTVQCHGGGCPFATKSVQPSGGTANLARLFAGKRLRSGANIAITVVAPGTTGRYLSFDTAPRAVPALKAGCSAPGSLSPIGCPGPAGPQGAQGPAGADGAAGAAGGSDAYTAGGAARTLSTASNVPVTVSALDNLPAGSYVMSSVAQAGNFNNVGEIVSCVIRVNGQSVAGTSAVVGNGAGSARASVLSASAAVTQANGFRATLECQSDLALASPASISGQRLTAIRVGTLHVQ